MINPLKRFFQRFTQPKNTGNASTAGGWTIPDHKSSNHIREIRILNGHTDIIRSLLPIDQHRFASSSDDGSIVIWNSETGERLLRLQGHTLCVTCMLLISRDVLVSGSADRTVKFWDLHTGTLLKNLANFHQGSVKCLARIDNDTFCSGGNDRFLYIWNSEGELISKIERQEEENLNCLLVISDRRIITGSNSSLLLAYDLDTQRCLKVLSYHRESVRCLVSISNDRFASGALDGSILVWESRELMPMFRLHYPESYINVDSHVYMYSVNHLVKIGDHFLGACIGNGFRVYDTKTGDCVVECLNAHNANVLSLIPLYNSTVLVSSSADTSIRMWSSKNGTFNFASIGLSTMPSLSSTSPTGTPEKKSKASARIEESRPRKFTPALVGEMWCHSDQVSSLLPLSTHSFASGAYDSCVILWKDGRVESVRRNEDALTSLMQWKASIDLNDASNGFSMFADVGSLQNDSSESEATDVDSIEGSMSDSSANDLTDTLVRRNTGFRVFDSSTSLRHVGERSKDSDPASPRGSKPLAKSDNALSLVTATKMAIPSSDSSIVRIGSNDDVQPQDSTATSSSRPNAKPVRVPEYIYDQAVTMLREQEMSFEQIRSQLRDDGHSEAIVEATVQKLAGH